MKFFNLWDWQEAEHAVIAKGEFLTLLGPSGCGKSTALRMIAGLSAPSSGALGWREGRTPELGFVFQEPTLMPWANVQRNVALPLELERADRNETAGRVARALAQVGLADFAHAYPRELSGGMNQRVAIAAMEPLCAAAEPGRWMLPMA